MAKLFTAVIVRESHKRWENTWRAPCPEWSKKDILERILVPLGEGSVESPVGMKEVAQIMHMLLSQSVLSPFLGTENENNSYLQGKH